MASTASPPLACAASMSRFCASSRLSASILVIPRSSPPTSDLKLAPSCDPTLRDRTVMPKTSPRTSVTSYPGRSFMVERIITFLPRRPSWPRVMPPAPEVPWNRGTRTRGAQTAPHRSPQQPGPDRAQAAVDQDQTADRAGIYRPEEPGPQPGAAHGL